MAANVRFLCNARERQRLLVRSESYLHGPGPDTALGGKRLRHERQRDAVPCGLPCASIPGAGLRHSQGEGSILDLEIPSKDPNLPPGFIGSLLCWGGTCCYFQPPKAGCLDVNWWEKASLSRAVMPVAILLPLASFPALLSTSVAFLYHRSPAQ